MTSFDDLTDSSPEGPIGIPEELTDDEVDPREDAQRGNLDGSTAHNESRADSLDSSREAVRDPSEASADESDLNSDVDGSPHSADAGDSGQHDAVDE